MKNLRWLWIPGFFFVVVSLFLALAYWRVGHIGLAYACATTVVLAVVAYGAAFAKPKG